MSFADKLRYYRKLRGVSQRKLAKDLNVSPSLVTMYETGDRKPSFEMLCELGRYFNVRINDLVADSEPGLPQMLPAGALPITTQRVPMLGTIHAGEPAYADADYEAYTEAGATIRCDFALRVVGDSMINARIMDGDIVFVRRQDTVQDGEIAAVLIDDEATLKRVRRLPGGMLMLQAENPKYQPIIIGGEGETRNVRILGKAVAFQSDVR